jgi:hypothetical protein
MKKLKKILSQAPYSNQKNYFYLFISCKNKKITGAKIIFFLKQKKIPKTYFFED